MSTLEGITLPEDLSWQDQYLWSEHTRGLTYLVTGAALIEESQKLAGRPITLTGAWASKTQVEALKALEDTVADMTLVFNGTSYTVRWRGDNPIEASTVIPGLADPNASSQYFLTLRMIEVG